MTEKTRLIFLRSVVEVSKLVFGEVFEKKLFFTVKDCARGRVFGSFFRKRLIEGTW